jgi:hypothetical protein
VLVEAAVEDGLVALVIADVAGSIAAAALIFALEWRRTSVALKQLALSDVIAAAIAPVDAPLRACLADGTIRLVRVGWLLSPRAEDALERDAETGALLMRRRQALPEEAFVPCEEAAQLLERGERMVLVLSHAWMSASHPDPTGITLAALLAHLRTLDGGAGGGVFIDFMSLPQKDAEGKRTDDEQATMGRGLKVMGSLYASLTGTCVLRQRTVPPAPAALAAVWNDTAYLNRGWCSFEHGMARVAAAHVEKAIAQLARHGAAGLPDLIRRAVHRGKLVDISAGGAAPLADDEGEPEALLEATVAAIEVSRFTNRGDRAAVQRLVMGYEWAMHAALDSVLAQSKGGALLQGANGRSCWRSWRNSSWRRSQLASEGEAPQLLEVEVSAKV